MDRTLRTSRADVAPRRGLPALVRVVRAPTHSSATSGVRSLNRTAPVRGTMWRRTAHVYWSYELGLDAAPLGRQPHLLEELLHCLCRGAGPTGEYLGPVRRRLPLRPERSELSNPAETCRRVVPTPTDDPPAPLLLHLRCTPP